MQSKQLCGFALSILHFYSERVGNTVTAVTQNRDCGHKWFRQLVVIAFSAALFRIRSVEPLDCTICRRFKSANKRVTVSREVPIICAISSWVRASFSRGSCFAASPFRDVHSRSSLASFSPAECDSPSDRTSWHALLYFSLSCSATRRHASPCSRRYR